jgi:ATP-dependent RNA helicase DDX24/MAK5
MPSAQPNSKRKLHLANSSSRKKAKVEHRNADELPWKTVTRPFEAGMGGDDGIMELEEVEGVEVVYETTDGGRVAKFNVRLSRYTSTKHHSLY